ncbi:MAG: DUF3857 domain-containing protein [Bacteroidota bacterium]
MKKIILQIFTLALIVSAVLLGGRKYPVSAIPSDLLPADKVVREISTTFEITGLSTAVLQEKYVTTIFSKKEEDEGVLVLWYDEYFSIDDLEGTIYDAEGNEVKTLEDSDVQDVPVFSSSTLHSDNRKKIASLFHNVYPYTIEFIYEIELSGSLNWPEWHAQRSIDPVERTSFTVICSNTYPLRYWCNTPDVVPEITDDGGDKVYRWSAAHLQSIDKNRVGEDLSDATTIVKIAPTDFQMDRYKGSMKSWKDFGSWIYTLYKTKESLPPAAAGEISSVVHTALTQKEKVKKLYEYMQSKTRYVSVQLGIGGWQPYDAATVHTKGYGDCKALVNYMKALLKQADIPSYPVIIKAGANAQPIISEFSSNQFNHVILCVPQETDSIWLECTSQSLPFGRLSDFTENREALLLTPEGGRIVRTPATEYADNRLHRVATVTITENGTANAVVTTTAFGNQQADIQGSLIDASPEDKERWMLGRMKMPDVALSSFTIEGLENHAPVITLNVTAKLPRYASANKSRIFFHPNLLAKTSYVPPKVEKRLSPVKFEYAYVDFDSIYFRIPKGFSSETLPKETMLNASFGRYHTSVVSENDTAIVYTRTLEIRQPSIPADRYSEYRDFCSEITKSDRAQVVLRKKE